MSRTNIRLLVGVLLTCNGCYFTAGPKHWMPTGQQTQTSTYGAWMEIRRVTGDTLGGEFVSASHDTLYIFHGATLTPISRNTIKSGRLIAWDGGASEVTGAAALGTISSISNGVILVLTGPMWMITGTVASKAQATKPIHNVAVPDYRDLLPWARFPQGFPRGLDQKSLRPKPTNK